MSWTMAVIKDNLKATVAKLDEVLLKLDKMQRRQATILRKLKQLEKTK